jgi:hypothetical protein
MNSAKLNIDMRSGCLKLQADEPYRSSRRKIKNAR